VLLAVAWPGRLGPGPAPAFGRYEGLASLAFAASSLLFVGAVFFTTIANALLLVSAMPLFAALMAWLILREVVPLRTWLAVVAGMAAMAVILSGTLEQGLGGGALIGDLCALGTAVAMAGMLTVFRARPQGDRFLVLGFGASIACAVGLVLGDPRAITAQGLAWLVALGAFLLPAALALVTIGPRYISAAEVALLILLEAVVSPIVAWLVLGEVPAELSLIGGAALLAVLVLHGLAGMRAERRARA